MGISICCSHSETCVCVCVCSVFRVFAKFYTFNVVSQVKKTYDNADRWICIRIRINERPCARRHTHTHTNTCANPVSFHSLSDSENNSINFSIDRKMFPMHKTTSPCARGVLSARENMLRCLALLLHIKFVDFDRKSFKHIVRPAPA